MKYKWMGLMIGLGVAFALQACTLPQPCTATNLSPPTLLSPAMWAVVPSLSPALTWEYPSPYIPSPVPMPYPYPYPVPYPPVNCFPESYRVRLSTGPEFLDELGGDTSDTTWIPSPLEPGKEYRWGVFAFSGGASKFAGSRYFFTGPICECDPDSLLAPTLIGPSGTIGDLEPTLLWDYPGDCSPQSYRVDLSTDPTFADTSLSGGTGNPSSRWGPAEKLQDCTTLYFRIAVACEMPGGETILGPYSAVQSFTTAESLCTEPVPYSLHPMFIPDIDANCRLGPNTLYARMGIGESGIPLEVIGRDAAGDWYLVQLREGLFCWMSEVTGELEGDKQLLEVNNDYPALPERKPDDQGSCNYSNQKSCEAAAGCVWVSGRITGSGYCTEQ